MSRIDKEGWIRLLLLAAVVNPTALRSETTRTEKSLNWSGLPEGAAAKAQVVVRIEGSVTETQFEVETPGGATVIVESRFDPGLDSMREELRLKGSDWRVSSDIRTGLAGMEPAYGEWDDSAADALIERLKTSEARPEVIFEVGGSKFVVGSHANEESFFKEVALKMAERLEGVGASSEVREAVRFLAAANRSTLEGEGDPFASEFPDLLVRCLDLALDRRPEEVDFTRYRTAPLRARVLAKELN